MNLNLPIDEISKILGINHTGQGDFIIRNIVVDTRSPQISENTLFIGLKGSKQDGREHVNEFIEKGGKYVLVNNPVQNKNAIQLIHSNPLEALQTIACHHRQKFDIPVIGITGSNGKTIVKEWLYHVLSEKFSIVRSPKSYNSQIGVPLSVLEMTDQHNLAIFEAGISMPGEMEKLTEVIMPTIGVFTGIGDAHNINFESKEQKLQEKFKLFEKVEKLIDARQLSLNFTIPFSDEASNKNASVVAETAMYLGLDEDQIANKLGNLPAISMRLEQIEGKNNCLLVNDTYNADIISLDIALKHLTSIAHGKKKVLFLSHLEGSKNEEVQERLIEMLTGAGLDLLVFIGNQKFLPKTTLNLVHFESVEQFLHDPLLLNDAIILFKGSRIYGLEKLVQFYAEKKHITRLEIDFNAMRQNLNYMKSKIADDVKVLVMVKAQSYGGGLTEIAQFLEDENVDYFGVAYADEGVQLRKAGITKNILVMNPEQNAFDDIIDYDLEPSIYSNYILNAFIKHLILRQMSGFPIHIKLDTGMHRLGFTEEDMTELYDTLLTQPEVFVKTAFSHLSVADNLSEKLFTYDQIRTFEIMTGSLKDRIGYAFDRHLANSAGTINFSNAHFNMVRIGIGLFGLTSSEDPNITNVLSFISQISQIKKIKEGDSVGYGRTFIADEPTTIGIIPVGYADGLRRELSRGGWQVLINGQKAPILGNVCMDMCMVNLKGIEAKVGDEVQLFGTENSIFDMARELRTIPYEIISSVSSRVHRVYIEE